MTDFVNLSGLQEHPSSPARSQEKGSVQRTQVADKAVTSARLNMRASTNRPLWQ
jgi:hypothetical protein